jgi:hypothetical protein
MCTLSCGRWSTAVFYLKLLRSLLSLSVVNLLCIILFLLSCRSLGQERTVRWIHQRAARSEFIYI